MNILSNIPETVWVAIVGLVGVLATVITAAIKDRENHGLQALQSAMEGQAALNQSLMGRLDQLEKKRVEQETRIFDLERRIDEKDSRIDKQEDHQRKLEKENTELSSKVDELKRRLDERDRNHVELERTLQKTQAYVAALRQHIFDRKPPPPPEPALE